MEELITIPGEMNEDKKSSITETIKAYSKRLFRFIRQRVNTPEDAEDILQDVFYKFIDNTQPIEQLTAWLFTTARNRITDSYRKKKPELLDDLFSVTDDEESFDWEEVLFTTGNDPETAYLRNLFWSALQEALDELPPEQKSVFILNEMEDHSFKQIAELTGEPVATLISRKRYAVLHLRKKLQALKDELLNF